MRWCKVPRVPGEAIPTAAGTEGRDREGCCSRWVELYYAAVPIGVEVNAGGSGICRILCDGLQVVVHRQRGPIVDHGEADEQKEGGKTYATNEGSVPAFVVSKGPSHSCCPLRTGRPWRNRWL